MAEGVEGQGDQADRHQRLRVGEASHRSSNLRRRPGPGGAGADAEAALAPVGGAAAQSMHSRASGLASRRAGAMGWPQLSQTP